MDAHQHNDRSKETVGVPALQASRLKSDPFFPEEISRGYPALNNQILAFHGLPEIHDHFGFKAAHQQVFGYRKSSSTKLGQLAESLTDICSPIDPFAQELAQRIQELAETPEQERTPLDIRYIPGSLPALKPNALSTIVDILKNHSLVPDRKFATTDIAESLYQTFQNNHPDQLEREQLAMHLMLSGLIARGFLISAD